MTRRADILLSTQRALLGAIPASLRAVTCDWTESLITLRFIFDGPIEEDDKESMRVVGAEVVADFAEDVMIEEEIIRIDYPQDLKAHARGVWIYLRKEKTTDGVPLRFSS